jgi:hypothetical protein
VCLKTTGTAPALFPASNDLKITELRRIEMKKEQNLRVDERFWQLHALAEEGDECAQADLWSEYEFTCGVDKVPSALNQEKRS